ncbi:MAG: VacB/RNase II family 3'-5' exoribonuclease [Spirochaetales bacterium]|nr:VacB/RNase II family 3'-5' exoribonuclease [Spirochaetales bacterium]
MEDSPEGKQSLRVVDSMGNSLVVPIRDLQFSSENFTLKEGKSSTPENLPLWITQAEEKAKILDLRQVWELLVSADERLVSLEDLASWIWDGLDGPGAYALFRTLRADKVYFKAKGNNWEIKTPEQVQAAEKQLNASSARAKEQQELAEILRGRIAEPSLSLSSEVLKKLEALRLYVLWEDEAPGKNTALEILGLLERSKTRDSAFKLLVELGLFHEHENLDLARSDRNTEFPSEVLEEAERFSQARLALDGRVDLTHHLMITIDDESTSEIDDGLSLEILPDGQKVFWIHIADPAAWVPLGSTVDQEARRRGVTLYLPEKRLTMFPQVLAEGPLSLRPGCKTLALSFSCRLNSDGSLESFNIVRSLVRSSERISYEQAEACLSESSPGGVNSEAVHLIQELGVAAQKRLEWRTAQGAVSIELPETDVHVDLEKDQVELQILPTLKSRELVAEFMVLAGEIAARFFEQRGCPTLFRTQSVAESPVDLEPLPAGPVREFAKILLMSRSVSTPVPAPHAGLGLKLYVQATSPIRRYSDLCVHRQIHSLLAGLDPVFSQEDLEALAGELDALSGQAAKLERQAHRYWMIEYLRRQKGKVWEAIVVGWFREDDRQAQVLLVEIGMRTLVKLSQTRPLGTSFRLKVSAADPRKDLLTFQEVGAP